jgi:hypothetical protein
MTPETMTLDGLISVQAMTARIACRWMSTRQLEAMSCGSGTRMARGARWNITSGACTTCGA